MLTQALIPHQLAIKLHRYWEAMLLSYKYSKNLTVVQIRILLQLHIHIEGV